MSSFIIKGSSVVLYLCICITSSTIRWPSVILLHTIQGLIYVQGIGSFQHLELFHMNCYSRIPICREQYWTKKIRVFASFFDSKA